LTPRPITGKTPYGLSSATSFGVKVYVPSNGPDTVIELAVTESCAKGQLALTQPIRAPPVIANARPASSLPANGSGFSCTSQPLTGLAEATEFQRQKATRSRNGQLAGVSCKPLLGGVRIYGPV
jgi:hypothetical protein